MVAAVLLAKDEIDLRFRPPRPKSYFELKCSYQVKSPSLSPREIQSRYRHKVLGVRPDGSYSMRTESLGGFLLADGERTKIKPRVAEITQYDPLGRRIESDKPTVTTNAWERVTKGVAEFDPPARVVKVGDRFGKILNSNDGKGVNDATLQFEVARAEKWKGQDAMRITFTYTEKFTKVFFEGYWLLRIKDAMPVAFRASGNEVPFVANQPPVEVVIAIDLVNEA